MHPSSIPAPLGRALRLGALILLGASVTALAADEPARGPAESGPAESAESIIAPTITGSIATPGGNLTPLPRDLPDAEGRISLYTDMGEGRIYAGPNALERAKLQMAREAIEASRAAGTLMMTAPQGPVIEIDREAAMAEKMRLLETSEPGVLPTGGADGVGESAPRIFEIGPDGLNEIERAKLAGEEPVVQSEIPADEQEPAQRESDAPRDSRKGDSR